MKISIIKSANEVVIGSLQITNEKLAKLMIRLNDAKNNLKKRRHTHWVRVSFEGPGKIELGDELMCIGDYDEYPISPDTKVIIPIEEAEVSHRQYICSTLNTPTLLQNKTLTENEEIIIVYTEIINNEGSSRAVNEMLLNSMKRSLFEYQMKAYTDYADEEMNKALFEKRVQQILHILPQLETLIAEQAVSSEEMQPEEEEAQERFHESIHKEEISYEDQIEIEDEEIEEDEEKDDKTEAETEVKSQAEDEVREETPQEKLQDENTEVACETQKTDEVDEDKTEDLGVIIEEEEEQAQEEQTDEENEVKWVKINLPKDKQDC